MLSFKLKNTQSAKAEQHPFHIVDSAPLPLFVRLTIVLIILHIVVLMTNWGQELRLQRLEFSPPQFDHVSPTAALFCAVVTLVIFWAQRLSDESLNPRLAGPIRVGLTIGSKLFISLEALYLGLMLFLASRLHFATQVIDFAQIDLSLVFEAVAWSAGILVVAPIAAALSWRWIKSTQPFCRAKAILLMLFSQLSSGWKSVRQQAEPTVLTFLWFDRLVVSMVCSALFYIATFPFRLLGLVFDSFGDRGKSAERRFVVVFDSYVERWRMFSISSSVLLGVFSDNSWWIFSIIVWSAFWALNLFVILASLAILDPLFFIPWLLGSIIYMMLTFVISWNLLKMLELAKGHVEYILFFVYLAVLSMFGLFSIAASSVTAMNDILEIDWSMSMLSKAKGAASQISARPRVRRFYQRRLTVHV
jgi:hypothetical protein